MTEIHLPHPVSIHLNQPSTEPRYLHRDTMMLMMMHTKTVLAVKEHDRSTPSSSQSSSRRDSNEGEENVQCTSGERRKEIKTWVPWLGAPSASGALAFLSTTFSTADLLKTAKASPPARSDVLETANASPPARSGPRLF